MACSAGAKVEVLRVPLGLKTHSFSLPCLLPTPHVEVILVLLLLVPYPGLAPRVTDVVARGQVSGSDR